MKSLIPSLLALASLASVASAQVRITEYLYTGTGGEFIEFTNLGSTAIDFTGWSFDDDSRVANTTSLSAFGLVAPGESVILTEVLATTFRTAWSLDSSIKVIGSNSANLGRNDEINLYNASGTLIDRLTYGDQSFPGTIRTSDISGWTTVENLGTNTIANWVLSSVGDLQGSYANASGVIGSPGVFVIPEPSTYAALLGVFAAGIAALRRRRAA